jgi:single-strand DNA-binding protein
MSNTIIRLPEQNSIMLVGRLTRDPEMRFTGKGQAMCRFDIAVNRRYKDATGNWQDDVSYIPVVVWGEPANRCGERLKKGMPVHVEGRLQSRQWETKEGQKRTTLEVVARRVQFLSRVSSESEGEGGGESTETASAPVPAAATTATDEEEIPF